MTSVSTSLKVIGHLDQVSFKLSKAIGKFLQAPQIPNKGLSVRRLGTDSTGNTGHEGGSLSIGQHLLHKLFAEAEGFDSLGTPLMLSEPYKDFIVLWGSGFQNKMVAINSTEPTNSPLRKRPLVLDESQEGIHRLDALPSFSDQALLKFVPLLPSRNSDGNGNRHQATHRLNPAGCIGRKPTVLHPIGDGANKQPQHCRSGDQQAQKHDCLLDQPFLLTSHPMQLHHPDHARSLPVVASVVHGGAA